MIKPVHPTVLAGPVATLGAGGPPSGINKRPMPGPWRFSRKGLTGDAQGDLKHHGGPEKAVHQYPWDHYSTWKLDLGDHPLLAFPGSFGENLSATGWIEENVCIGDVVRFGSALLQVSQGRQPCFKLNLRFGRSDMAAAVQRTGRSGWYYRVLEEGEARQGDALVMVDRPRPDWPLLRLIEILYRNTSDQDGLIGMAALHELAEGWRALAKRRLETRQVEDSSKRLGLPRT